MFERLDETQLPEKEKFYSSLSGKGITEEEYAHVQEVWATFDAGRQPQPVRGHGHAAAGRRA